MSTQASLFDGIFYFDADGKPAPAPTSKAATLDAATRLARVSARVGVNGAAERLAELEALAEPRTIVVADGTVLPLDLDGDPYRCDSIGPWKVTPCCGAYATGTDYGIACKGCFGEAFNDAPARLAEGAKPVRQSHPDAFTLSAILAGTAFSAVIEDRLEALGLIEQTDAPYAELTALGRAAASLPTVPQA